MTARTEDRTYWIPSAPRTLLTLLALATCCLLSTVEVVSYVSMFIIAIELLTIFVRRPFFAMKYAFLVFSTCAAIIGCWSAEFGGVFLSELSTISGFAGSIPLLVLSEWVFIRILLSLDSKMEISTSNPTYDSGEIPGWFSIANIITFCIGLYVFARVAPHPSFLLGVDRFQYSQAYNIGGYGSLASLLGFLIVVPVMCIRYKQSKIGMATVALYAMYQLWVGQKFGAFLSLLCVFIFVYYDKLLELGEAKARRILAAILCAIVALVVLAVGVMSTLSHVTPTEYLASRTAQQGQLWWRTYSLSGGDAHLEEVHNELQAIIDQKNEISENVGSMNGIYRIMYLTAPANIVNAKIKSGSRYTEAGFAAAYYYGGALGCVLFAALMACIFSAFVNLMLCAVHRVDAISAAICLRLIHVSQTVLSMFTFSLYFSPVTIAFIVYLVISTASRARMREQTRDGLNRTRQAIGETPSPLPIIRPGVPQ